jgi:pectin methylesterase-like acyl-CoA thioesterase
MKPRMFTVLASLIGIVSVLTLLCLLAGPAMPAQADATTYYVAPGSDCGGVTPCYATIQAAVDAATNGDTIKVVQGVYTTTDFQVVYIAKAITLTGSYTTSDWANSFPITRPSVMVAALRP